MKAIAVAGSALSISDVSPATPEEWDTIWQECDYATYFHGREWMEFWQRLKPGAVTARPLLVQFSDNRRALVPFSQQLRAGGLLSTLTSSMEGTFGGAISCDELRVEHELLLTDHLLNEMDDSLSWRINPYAPHAQAVIRRVRELSAGFAASESRSAKVAKCVLNWQKPLLIEDATHTMDLRRGFDSLFSKQSSMVRKAKKAQRAGVEIGAAESLDDWQEYYRVYQSSVERWGNDPGSAYPWELFRLIGAAKSERVKLWVARHEGKIVSGAVCFYAKTHSVYWHGSSLKEFFELRPVNLLMLEIMRDACARGYSWYDFNPSGFLPGVIAFKESLGAKPLTAPMVYVDDSVKRAARVLLLGARGYQ